MGIKNLLRFGKSKKAMHNISQSVPESEKKYYHEDSYYTTKAFEGTQFERDVVTFEKRKEMSFPSARGLYVAEILLLDYVAQGKYPSPKNGYPGFWWFAYGIRDVGAKLSELEYKGFIEWGSVADSLTGLTGAELKEILDKFGLKATGKKAELVKFIKENISEEQLSTVIPEKKYKLTPVGEMELKDNEYVPYMHKEKAKTSEAEGLGPAYNVWSINKLLRGNTANWKEVVEKEFKRMESHYGK